MLFRTPDLYRRHCKDHRVEVHAVDCPDYELRALDFLTKPQTASMHECKRNKGDIVRYDDATNEYAVLAHDGFIRTYMIPKPAFHGLPTNLDYYQRECLSH
jgi:filamentous hemagglutinin